MRGNCWMANLKRAARSETCYVNLRKPQRNESPSRVDRPEHCVELINHPAA